MSAFARETTTVCSEYNTTTKVRSIQQQPRNRIPIWSYWNDSILFPNVAKRCVLFVFQLRISNHSLLMGICANSFGTSNTPLTYTHTEPDQHPNNNSIMNRQTTTRERESVKVFARPCVAIFRSQERAEFRFDCPIEDSQWIRSTTVHYFWRWRAPKIKHSPIPRGPSI